MLRNLAEALKRENPERTAAHIRELLALSCGWATPSTDPFCSEGGQVSTYRWRNSPATAAT
jgi:hypothetical protein